MPSTGLRVGRSFYQSLPPTAEPFNWEEKDNRNFYNRFQRAAIGSKTKGKRLLPAQIFPSHIGQSTEVWEKFYHFYGSGSAHVYESGDL